LPVRSVWTRRRARWRPRDESGRTVVRQPRSEFGTGRRAVQPPQREPRRIRVPRCACRTQRPRRAPRRLPLWPATGPPHDRYRCESDRRRMIDLSRMISVSSREVFSPQRGLTGVRRGGGSALRPPSISARVRHRGRRAGRPGHRRVVTPSPGAAVWVSPRRAPDEVAVMAGPA
jgi:hypothetical protein